jgi:rhodanese-related sulfurtransferase
MEEPMAPLTSFLHPGTLIYFLVFLFIGMGFGAILEMAGFGDSRKLAAQFYLKDLTVLKVMFTGIIVACVLIFLSSGLGLLNFDRIWVNPTYLNSEIVGGLIMGVGFIVGGFCPGTSLVAASTLKLDGVVFVLGGLFGVWAFGESVGFFEDFFYSSYFGRLTLYDWLGISPGMTVLLVVLMALVMFYFAEIAEAYWGEPQKKIIWRPYNAVKISAASLLVAACGLLLIVGQPTPLAKWDCLQNNWSKNLTNREVYVHPGEVLELKKNASLSTRILDVRSESDFNIFHIAGAQRLDPAEIAKPATVARLLSVPENTVFLLVSADEGAATQAWKELKASGVLNLFIVEGGINKWLEVFPPEPCLLAKPSIQPSGSKEQLRYSFSYAVGTQSRAAHPDSIRPQPWLKCPEITRTDLTTAAAWGPNSKWFESPVYEKKVKLQRKVATKGGCG